VPLCVFGSLLFGLPAVFVVWISRRKRLGVCLAVLYSQVLAFLAFLVLVTTRGWPPFTSLELSLMIWLHAGALMLMLLGVLHFIRVCGYELRRPGQPGLEPPAGSREKEPQMNTDERREE
jgi:hypothetical protein